MKVTVISRFIIKLAETMTKAVGMTIMKPSRFNVELPSYAKLRENYDNYGDKVWMLGPNPPMSGI
jgi:hypothetical protein